MCHVLMLSPARHSIRHSIISTEIILLLLSPVVLGCYGQCCRSANRTAVTQYWVFDSIKWCVLISFFFSYLSHWIRQINISFGYFISTVSTDPKKYSISLYTYSILVLKYIITDMIEDFIHITHTCDAHTSVLMRHYWQLNHMNMLGWSHTNLSLIWHNWQCVQLFVSFCSRIILSQKILAVKQLMTTLKVNHHFQSSACQNEYDSTTICTTNRQSSPEKKQNKCKWTDASNQLCVAHWIGLSLCCILSR